MAFIPSIFVLGLAAWFAWLFTSKTALQNSNQASLSKTSLVLILALVAQILHFAEELWSDLPGNLAELTGLPSMPGWFFIAFNAVWVVVWAAAIPGLKSRQVWALFAAWFLALAGIANGVLHPILSWIQGGYFAGTYSAPLVGLSCAFLAFRLKCLRPDASASSV